MKIIKFTKAAIKDYRRVGAIVPSSGYISRRIGKMVSGDLVLEYGAGNGVITKEILKGLSSEAKLIAFELNDEFFKELQEIKDARLLSLHEDVRKAEDYLDTAADTVVSGVPFSLMKKKEREEIISKTASLIRPGGVFLVYQTSLIVLTVLKKYFSEVKIKFEPRNFPPYFIMTAKK